MQIKKASILLEAPIAENLSVIGLDQLTRRSDSKASKLIQYLTLSSLNNIKQQDQLYFTLKM